jgi:hypothetical protein
MKIPFKLPLRLGTTNEGRQRLEDAEGDLIAWLPTYTYPPHCPERAVFIRDTLNTFASQTVPLGAFIADAINGLTAHEPSFSERYGYKDKEGHLTMAGLESCINDLYARLAKLESRIFVLERDPLRGSKPGTTPGLGAAPQDVKAK